MTAQQGVLQSQVRVGLIADTFAEGGALFEGGAERHMFRLAEAMSSFGVHPVVYQPGPIATDFVLAGIEVRSRTVGRRPWRELAEHARLEGCTHLYFKYLEHVPGGLPSRRVAATQHGVHWDIPYADHGRAWYPGGPLARAYLPAWRSREITRSLMGLRRAAAVSAMDTTFLRVAQAIAPTLRGRVFVTSPFSDLHDSPPDPTVIPESVRRAIDSAHGAGAFVILVPRNLSLIRGESWLPRIATAVNRACPALFIASGRFMGRLDHNTRRERLEATPTATALAGTSSRSCILHLGGFPHSASNELLRQADLVLIPSFAAEGASLAAAEAMAAGKAVVATNVGGLNDTIYDRWTGLLTRPDPDELARAVVRLCRQPALRASLGVRARDQARSCFALDSWRAAQVPFFHAAGWLENGL